MTAVRSARRTFARSTHESPRLSTLAFRRSFLSLQRRRGTVRRRKSGQPESDVDFRARTRPGARIPIPIPAPLPTP